MANMRILIRMVFAIFIAKGIDCLGSNNYCSFYEYENIIKDEDNIIESLVDSVWYGHKENLVVKIFEKDNDNIFTSKDNKYKISIESDEEGNHKIVCQNEAGDELKLKDKKYALFEIKTQEGENTVYLYCSDVESSKKKEGIFAFVNHISISVIAGDTKNVTNMVNMFIDCSNLEELNLKNFNTENVTDMSFMFSGCNKLTELDLKNFDTKKVTNMECMFYECSSLENLDIKNFNTEKVTKMQGMFYDCRNLEKLEIGENFKTENVNKKKQMFDGCNKLTEEFKKIFQKKKK